MPARRMNIRIKSGSKIDRKSIEDSDPLKNNGSKAVIKTMNMIIMLNMTIRYLNFNVYSPIITRYWNHKRKMVSRQRYEYRGI